jgi:hypothetical protein
MIVSAYVASRRDRNLGHPQFIFAIQFRQVACIEWRLVENLCGDPFGINLQRFGRADLRRTTREGKEHCGDNNLNLHGSSFRGYTGLIHGEDFAACAILNDSL